MDTALFILIIIAIGFVVGIITGIVIEKHLLCPKSFGRLHIKKSDEDNTNYLFLELDESPNKICDHGYVTFKVVTDESISQK